MDGRSFDRFRSIYVKLNPVNIDDDLPSLPKRRRRRQHLHSERLKVDRSNHRTAAVTARRIISDFPMNGVEPVSQSLTGSPRARGIVAPGGNAFTNRSQRAVLSGGNAIKLHTSLGKIEIFKIKLCDINAKPTRISGNGLAPAMPTAASLTIRTTPRDANANVSDRTITKMLEIACELLSPAGTSLCFPRTIATPRDCGSRYKPATLFTRSGVTFASTTSNSSRRPPIPE
jgi:hypothetical protein